jgi:hypothetical protein
MLLKLLCSFVSSIHNVDIYALFRVEREARKAEMEIAKVIYF